MGVGGVAAIASTLLSGHPPTSLPSVPEGFDSPLGPLLGLPCGACRADTRLSDPWVVFVCGASVRVLVLAPRLGIVVPGPALMGTM
jgi:hypothetical protein